MSGMNGTDVLLQLNTGTPAAPVWTTVAAQRDASVSRSNDTIDFSTKDQRERRVGAGRFESELSLEGLVPVAGSPGFDALLAACEDGTLIQVQTLRAGTPHKTASGIVTKMDDEYPDQGESTFSATVAIDGAWADPTP